MWYTDEKTLKNELIRVNLIKNNVLQKLNSYKDNYVCVLTEAFFWP